MSDMERTFESDCPGAHALGNIFRLSLGGSERVQRVSLKLILPYGCLKRGDSGICLLDGGLQQCPFGVEPRGVDDED